MFRPVLKRSLHYRRHPNRACFSSSSKKGKDESSSRFGFSKEWKERIEKDVLPGAAIFSSIVPPSGTKGNENNKKQQEESFFDLFLGDKSNDSSVMADNVFKTMAGGIMSIMGGGGSDEKTKETISDIVTQVRESTDQGELHDSQSINEIFDTLRDYKDLIDQVAEKYVSGIDFAKLTPTTLLYYLEREDERKNPSWKNRVHRFCPGIDIDKMVELNHKLDLALLSYADTADEIRDGLACHPVLSGELVYCDLKSAPGEPAHFIAVRTDDTSQQGILGGAFAPLQVIIGVRGTKSFADAITDVLCDSQKYKDGKAHEFIVKGGTYLFQKHKDLLESLAQKAGKKKIKLLLVGHSLGAGAASIAGIEFNELSNFDVEVVGFGCPALLSKDLAEKSTFITTIVNDSDAIPRTSAASITNLLLDLVEFDWREYAKRDIRHALAQLQRANPSFFTEQFVRKIRSTVEPLVDTHLEGFIEKDLTNRIPRELYPPGRVIHLYHDGVGVSGCYVPNDFFDELDVTRRMVDDHVFHTGYQQVFLEIMRQHKNDHHFSFQNAIDS